MQSGMVPGVQKCTSFCFDRLSYDEKSAAQGAKKGRFCMGILVTLGLSTENAPRAGKNIFADKVACSEYP